MGHVAVEWVEERAGDEVSWRRTHEELLRLAARRAGLDREEGRWLLRAVRTAIHRRLGYGSFFEYAERLFGYGPRLTQEKVRVAEALEELPELARELEGGSISFSAVRELTRVATAATERAWLAAARGRTVREVEQLVTGLRPGNVPGDVADAAAKRHVLRLEVTGDVLAAFREVMAKITKPGDFQTWGQSLRDCVLGLNEYLLGWMGFFHIISRVGHDPLMSLDAHIRRRLRAIAIRHWRRRRRDGWRPVKPGRRSWWRLSNSRPVTRALSNAHFAERGLVALADVWHRYQPQPDIASAQLTLALG